MSHPLHVVDVFAETRLAGNPLAVVLDADDLSTKEMQAIALEMNYSETTFVTGPPDDGAVPVRIFTPTVELPFAGHPTLGTAWVLRQVGLGSNGVAEVVTLKLGVGRVPVRFEHEGGDAVPWLTAPRVELGRTCAAERIAPALGLEAADIDDMGPVQEADAGIRVTIVPVRTLDALRRSWLDRDLFGPLERDGIPPFVYLFSTEPRRRGNDLSARFYFVANGVREDPATGSATACLGTWLLEHGALGPPPHDLRIEQGDEMERSSLLYLRTEESGAAPTVSVGGRVIPSVRGTLL